MVQRCGITVPQPHCHPCMPGSPNVQHGLATSPQYHASTSAAILSTGLISLSLSLRTEVTGYQKKHSGQAETIKMQRVSNSKYKEIK